MTHAWQPSGKENAEGRSILIIEDNETLGFGLRTSLEVEGYTVDCVTDGAGALHWLETNDPDLIVLDLMLPNVNGFEVLRRYRASGGTAAVLMCGTPDPLGGGASRRRHLRQHQPHNWSQHRRQRPHLGRRPPTRVARPCCPQ